MLDKITRGNATLEDLDKMEELCYYIKENAYGWNGPLRTRCCPRCDISATNTLRMSSTSGARRASANICFSTA